MAKAPVEKVSERKKWPPELRREWVEKLMSKQVTLEQAVKELNVQSYQILAWMGQAMLNGDVRVADTTSGVESPEFKGWVKGLPQTPKVNPIESGETGTVRALIDKDLTGNAADNKARFEIVEWYIRNKIMAESP